MRSVMLNIIYTRSWLLFHSECSVEYLIPWSINTACCCHRDVGMTRTPEFQGPCDLRLYMIDKTVKCGLECYATTHLEHYATVTVINHFILFHLFVNSWVFPRGVIVRATILFPSHVVKSLQFIWRSDTFQLNLWVSHFQLSYSEFTWVMTSQITVNLIVYSSDWWIPHTKGQ